MTTNLSKPKRVLAGLIILACCAIGIRYLIVESIRRPDITVGYNSLAIASTPLILALNNLPAEQSLKRVPFPTGRLALDALLAGKVDIATVADVPTVLASAQRPDLRVILVLTESPIRIVANKQRIRNLSDLEPRRVGTFLGTSAQYFLYAEVEKVGVDIARITPQQSLQPPDAISALSNGSVDAISVWEPFAQQAIDVLGQRAIVFENPSVYQEKFLLVTTTEVLNDAKKRRAILKLVSSVIRATKATQRQEAQSIELIAKTLSLEPNLVRKIWPEFTFLAALPSDLPGSLARIEAWASALQLRPARNENAFNDFVDPSVLLEAK
jgi:ABC-type nitrate/sulfonate/bicarbonate transport system substrate-binding protein